MPLAAFLLSLAAPLVSRVLLALGMGFVSYAVLNAIASNVVTQVQNYWGSSSGVVVGMVELSGFGQAIGIILGGIVARAALGAISRLQKV